MNRPATTGHDRRPRIHLYALPTGAEFSLGPCGRRVRAQSVGEAVETAIEAVERQPAVIIFEGAAHG
jgi:hypothetical protein